MHCVCFGKHLCLCVCVCCSCWAVQKLKSEGAAAWMLSKHFQDWIFTLWMTIMSSPTPLPLPLLSICYCCRLFPGKRNQKQAKAINPHHQGHPQPLETTDFCHAHVYHVLLEISPMNASFTHSSDSRCSRWKAPDWISLMLFMLRSLEKKNGAGISIKVSVSTRLSDGLWRCMGRAKLLWSIIPSGE